MVETYISPVRGVLRAAARSSDEPKPLNILIAPTHERTQSNLARTGHNFWAIRTERLLDWKAEYAPVPDNVHLLDKSLPPDRQVPPDVDIDLVLAEQRVGAFQTLAPLAMRYNVPLIALEHCIPEPRISPKFLADHRKMRGHLNLFISAVSRRAWGWKEDEAEVIHHGVNTNVFKPARTLPGLIAGKSEAALSVVNDWINRDIPCGFSFWKQVVEGLAVNPVGNTPGLSRPAKNLAELVRVYRAYRIFVNTSQYSPIPTSLLEAMACGCAVVSTDTCMIPEVITHGVDGILVKTPQEMRKEIIRLQADPEECDRLGRAARERIVSAFSLDKYVANWNAIFERASRIIPWKTGRWIEE